MSPAKHLYLTSIRDSSLREMKRLFWGFAWQADFSCRSAAKNRLPTNSARHVALRLTTVNIRMHQPSQPQTITQLLALAAQEYPARTALLDVYGKSLTFAELAEEVNALGRQLRAKGIARHDHVALVAPDGMEMAVAILAIASHAVAAPLNPNYRTAEFEFYLRDLEPAAIVVPPAVPSGLQEAARHLQIPLLTHNAHERHVLQGTTNRKAIDDVPSDLNDIALILHTSGSTARPKMVPLLQRNLSASARNNIAALALTPGDRTLNVMPLFHIHGLMAGLFVPLAAGASVVCAPGWNAAEFYSWLDAFHPTYYSAVPTMHQLVLSRAHQFSRIIARARLRFIRSASAALPLQVLQGLEQTFHVPVIETYGMTETTQQVTSNLLPPAVRKPGSAGRAVGTEIAIMAQDRTGLLRPTTLGEIVVRGANVMPGYLNNPAANAAAFTEGWFRTGDLGTLDEDGYLTVVGRRKEMINRGGEKIAPSEVEQVLLSHPVVAQAVVFGIPESTLGEQVGAAVVCKPGTTIAVPELQRHVTAQLALFKVPRRIVFLDEIPKGVTGKLQRLGMAERLGLVNLVLDSPMPDDQVRALPETEAFVRELWCDILQLPTVSEFERFIDVGGDSLQATRLVARINAAMEINLDLVDFFEAATVARQARVVQDKLLAQMDPIALEQKPPFASIRGGNG